MSEVRIFDKRIFYLHFFLIAVSFLMFFFKPGLVSAQEINNKKAIIFIIDNFSLEELMQSNTPHLKSLIKRGGVAHLNIRTKSSLTNRGSSFLSLALGTRTSASIKGGLAYNRDEIMHEKDLNTDYQIPAKKLYEIYMGKSTRQSEVLNIATADIQRVSEGLSPDAWDNLFGKIAKEYGLKIGFLGNSDTSVPKRESTMLAMDESGQIPYGNVSSELLLNDNKTLGGKRLNDRILFKETKRILSLVDVLFIDYGDTVRVEEHSLLPTDSVKKAQKIMAVERADNFLGSLLSLVDLKNTLIIVISPNPAPASVKNGNFGLTPIIMLAPDATQGLLTSSTTRRAGVVANFDVMPTILDFFTKNKPESEFSNSLKIIPSINQMEELSKNENFFLRLRKSRPVFHLFFLTLNVFILAYLFVQLWRGKAGQSLFVRHLSVLYVLSVPVTLLIISNFKYNSIFSDLVFVFGGALFIALALKLWFKNFWLSVSTISLITTSFLMIDTFFLKEYILNSPLGSDVIAGNRYYGIGNDYMGILLGSTTLGLFSLFEYLKVTRVWLAIGYSVVMSLTIIALSPIFGANMGGTFSAITMLAFSLFIIFDRNLSLFKVTLLLFFSALAVVMLSVFDAKFNTNPTHAGKALQALLTKGWPYFEQIILAKLRQASWNLANANWRFILVLDVIFLILTLNYRKKYLKDFKVKLPVLSKGLLTIAVGAIMVICFNDTGTVAAALMLNYMVLPALIPTND